MASNPIPDKLDSLLSLAEDMADGCEQHQGDIGIAQNTETVMRNTIAATRTAETAFGAAQVAKKNTNTALQVADSNGKAFIADARRRLSKFFGESYSTEWSAAGWPNGSTSTPPKQDERMNLLASIRDYLTATPAHASADMGVTAAIAEARFQAVSDARMAAALASQDCGERKNLRDAAVANLRKRARGLIAELETLLADDDPRWHAFGLNLPGETGLPDVPENLVLVAGDPGTVFADWSDARLAERYRVFQQIIGTDPEFVAGQTVYDSDATLSGLPVGATLRLRVTAANSEGESLPSTEVEIVVP
jgi:hypothetical protein